MTQPLVLATAPEEEVRRETRLALLFAPSTLVTPLNQLLEKTLLPTLIVFLHLRQQAPSHRLQAIAKPVAPILATVNLCAFLAAALTLSAEESIVANSAVSPKVLKMILKSHLAMGPQ